MPILAILLAELSTVGPCATSSAVSEQVLREAVGPTPRLGESMLSGVMQSDEVGQVATVFVRSGSRWLAYPIEDTQEVVGDAEGPKGERLVLAFHTAEGPGEQFSGLLFDRSGTLLACPVLEFPDALNRDVRTGERDYRMDLLVLDRVTLGANGRGEASASGDIGPEGRTRHVVYRYFTNDGGMTWSAPRRVEASARPRRVRR